VTNGVGCRQRPRRKSLDALKNIRASICVGKFTARAKAIRASRYQAFPQSVDRGAPAVADDVAVDPEGYTDIAMAELIPDHGDGGSALHQFRRDRMSERVKPGVGHLQGLKKRP